MSVEPRPQRRVLVDVPAQRIKAGDVGTLYGEALLSRCVTLHVNGRYVTLRADQVEPVEVPA